MTSIVLGVIDIECQRLPRTVVAGMALGGVVLLAPAALLDGRVTDLARGLVAAFGVFVMYTVLAVIARGGLAFGDVTLFGAVSLYLGWVGWDAVFAGIMITTALGGIIGLLVMLFGRARMGDRFAYGPMIIAGASLALLVP